MLRRPGRGRSAWHLSHWNPGSMAVTRRVPQKYLGAPAEGGAGRTPGTSHCEAGPDRDGA